jgi:hypothetical protein
MESLMRTFHHLPLAFRVGLSALLLSSSALAEPVPPAAAPHPQPAPAAPPAPPPAQPWIRAEISTLGALRAKGVLSQAEYDSAVRDLVETSGARTADDTTIVVGKFATTIYGYAELDTIWDSTQSFSDVAGNGLVAPNAGYAGSHSRVQFGARNSRFGIRMKAPETKWLRASGVLEMDFEGATLPIGSGQPYFGSESAFFNSPTFRLRLAYLKLETPIVDMTFGSTWHLFGGGPAYFPCNVGIQGLPGEIFSRAAQVKLSHTFRSEAVEFEIAAAALRPPQRNSGVPEGAAALRLAFPKWSGMQTINSTGTQIAPLSLTVSGDVRKIAVAEWSADPKVQNSKLGMGVAVDALLPIIPATKAKKGNSLTLSGEFVYGRGIADLYTGLNGGVPIAPALPNPTGANPAPAYTPDIDPGIAAYDATGKLGLIQWTTFNVGLQYYFPGLDGRLWVSGNYARTMSANAKDYATTPVLQGKVRDHEEWFDANLFGDPLPGVRFGLEYARFNDTYVDGSRASNHRVQFSAFYIF